MGPRHLRCATLPRAELGGDEQSTHSNRLVCPRSITSNCYKPLRAALSTKAPRLSQPRKAIRRGGGAQDIRRSLRPGWTLPPGMVHRSVDLDHVAIVNTEAPGNVGGGDAGLVTTPRPSTSRVLRFGRTAGDGPSAPNARRYASGHPEGVEGPTACRTVRRRQPASCSRVRARGGRARRFHGLSTPAETGGLAELTVGGRTESLSLEHERLVCVLGG